MNTRIDTRQSRSHQALLTEAWTLDVAALQRGIAAFPTPPVSEYHVSLFEMDGDPQLHVNVTHREETKRVGGWLGPGVSADGFVYSHRFDAVPTSSILRSIRQKVFAARA